MSLDYNEIIFLSVALLILWRLLRHIFKLVDQITDYFIGTILPDETWTINTHYTTLVEQAILYTNDILYNLGIDRFPSYRIYYYEQQNFMGKFDGDVIVYTKNHNDIKEVVNTVLHEVAHFIQSQTAPDYKKYDNYTKQFGTWDNPLEQQARRFANEHLNSCLLFLERKGLVKRG